MIQYHQRIVLNEQKNQRILRIQKIQKIQKIPMGFKN